MLFSCLRIYGTASPQPLFRSARSKYNRRGDARHAPRDSAEALGLIIGQIGVGLIRNSPEMVLDSTLLKENSPFAARKPAQRPRDP